MGASVVMDAAIGRERAVVAFRGTNWLVLVSRVKG